MFWHALICGIPRLPISLLVCPRYGFFWWREEWGAFSESWEWYVDTARLDGCLADILTVLYVPGYYHSVAASIKANIVDSLLYLPTADAVVITFLAPGLSCWACSFLIKEPFTRIEKIGTFVSLIGVIFIARPATLFGSSGAAHPVTGNTDGVPGAGDTKAPSSAANYDNVTPEQRLFAVGIALVGVCGAVSAFVTIRWIGKRAHPLISVNYFAVWCTIVASVAQLTIPGVGGFLFPSTPRDWFLLFFLG